MESDQKIEIKVFINSKDYQRTLFWYFKNKIFLLLLMLTFTLVMSYISGFEGFSFLDTDSLNSILMSVSVLLLGLLPLILFYIFYFIWKQSKKINASSEETRYVFSKSGMQTDCKLCSSNVAWEKFIMLGESKTDFVIFIQKNMYYPIPKRFFESQIQIEEFRKLVKYKLGDKAKLLN